MIPVSSPSFNHDLELEYVTDCIKNNEVCGGKYVKLFEESWAEYCHMKCGISTNTGTSALQSAIYSLDIEPGSEIIIPSFTIISCALATIYNNLIPVFIDVDETWCINTDIIESAITPKTKAIMAVHMYGHPCKMKQLKEICEKHNLYLIEDAAQAHGATYDGKPCGSFGDVSCFSFYGNKLISTGEGGMVLTNNYRFRDKLLKYRNLCFGDGLDRFEHSDLGNNFRMPNIAAAIGLAQISSIDRFIESKRNIFYYYRHHITHPKITLQPVIYDSSFWMNGIIYNGDVTNLAKKLKKSGVDTRPFFKGLHTQQCLSDKSRNIGKFDMTETLSNYGLYLPSGVDITIEELELVVNAINENA